MERRSFLALAGSGFLAGCSGSDGGFSSPTPSPTPEVTPTPTPTATSEPQGPSIETLSLVSRWEDFGDASEAQIEAVGQGAPALIAFRYFSEVHDGTVDTTEQVKVFDESGSRVGLEDDTGEQLVDESGYESWEHALSFDTSQWELGEYEAELLIRDNVTGKTSDNTTTTFQVNDPLGESATNLVSIDGPDTIQTGQRYEFTVTFENTSNRDGSVVSTVSARFLRNEDWYTYSDWEIQASMAAGETNTYEGYITEFSEEGTVQLRIDETNDTWTVDVTG